jgi:transposase
MPTRAPYRRHSTRFKLQVCKDIRSGLVSRGESQRRYRLSNSLLQQWLGLFDRDEFDAGGDDEALSNECSARLAALERDLSRLAMELERLRQRLGPEAVEGAQDRRG